MSVFYGDVHEIVFTVLMSLNLFLLPKIVEHSEEI